MGSCGGIGFRKTRTNLNSILLAGEILRASRRLDTGLGGAWAVDLRLPSLLLDEPIVFSSNRLSCYVVFVNFRR